MEEKNLGKFDNLRQIIARLRGPGGCPWDKVQTHATLKGSMLEECYETLEAIDSGQPDKLCEELGDLLLQIMLHSQIADEAGQFKIEDVISGITQKLIRRHPHVFGETKVNTAQEVSVNWEKLKNKERPGQSILEGLPKGMPALSYSQAMQRRVARVGFDWEKTDDIMDKLVEEVAEFKEAPDQQRRSQEFGDLLFFMVNLARRLDIDPERALQQKNQRSARRFNYMEDECRRRGMQLSSLSLKEMDALWDEAKRKLGE
jgi:tetrapyrrole methylase family protein / MazG family protein